MANRPRKHHYVPRFLLKGFTKEGTSDGTLWVTDVERMTQRASNVNNAAVEGDFYRVDLGPGIDPMWFEKILGNEVEPSLSKALDFILDTKDVPPCGLARDAFLNLVATSIARGPLMRTLNSQSFDGGVRNSIRKMAESEEGRTKLKRQLEATEQSLEEFLALLANKDLAFDLDRFTHIKAIVSQVGLAVEGFDKREWAIRESAPDVPDLICSDAPVGLIPLGKVQLSETVAVWFNPNVLVVMPLSRRIAVFGSLTDRQLPELLDTQLVVAINDAVARGACQIYSSEQVFAVSKPITGLNVL